VVFHGKDRKTLVRLRNRLIIIILLVHYVDAQLPYVGRKIFLTIV
jgi:hypothetical protein